MTAQAQTGAPLDKERATAVVTQALSEKGVALQSVDEAGTVFKSQPFEFNDASNLRYLASFVVKLQPGQPAQVSLADIKFRTGLPVIFKPSAAAQASLTNPVAERLQALLAGTPGAPGAASANGANGANGGRANPNLISAAAFEQQTRGPWPVPTGDQLNQFDVIGLTLDTPAAQVRKILSAKTAWMERPFST